MKCVRSNQEKKAFGTIWQSTVAVADIFAIAFMFVMLILAAVFMHAYNLRPLRAATDRQLELKSEHLYMTLELAWVEPYSVSFLRAAAENLLLEEPVVPEPHLRSAMENVLEYLRPSGYGVMVRLVNESEGREWVQVYPGDAAMPGAGVKQFTRQGEVRLTMAGGENVAVAVPVTVRIFEIPKA